MDEPPFNPRAIQLTTGALGIVIAITAIYSIYGLLPYFIALVIAIGMKYAAPKIPFVEIVVCVATSLLGMEFFDYLFVTQSPIFLIVGNLVSPAICVMGFGYRWVKKGWLPEYANRW